MQFLSLLMGTVLTVLLILKLVQSGQYDYLTGNLESSEYPLSELYGIGYAWNEVQIVRIKGRIKEDLMGQAKLLYESKYAEYYATLAWVQMITFVHLSLCTGFVLAGLFNSALFALIGMVCAGVFGYYFITKMKKQLSDRQLECAIELPEIVSTMALLINSGMVLRKAWELIANSKEGTVYTLMRDACNDMKYGMSEVDAIYRFGVLSNSPEIKKFTSALIQGIENGSRDLSDLLCQQSSEMWILKKQLMLQKGEAAASKLLIPTTLIFLGIIIVVISGAVGMLI